jgi:hypothetical protein
MMRPHVPSATEARHRRAARALFTPRVDLPPPVRAGRHPAGGRGLARGTLGITAIAVAVAVARSPGWSALQWVLAMGVAFDFAGGVVANATSAAKRSLHRPGRTRSRMLFYAGHVHPLVLPLAFSVSWTAAAALYAGMLAAATLVELAPRDVAQPVAFAAVAAGLLMACGAGWPIGLEWFAPVYLLKLVGAYAVPPDRG